METVTETEGLRDEMDKTAELAEQFGISGDDGTLKTRGTRNICRGGIIRTARNVRNARSVYNIRTAGW